jgi:RecA/RadA recombinase
MATAKEDLVSTIADALNKLNKDEKIAYFIGEEDTPTDFSDFISTGSSMLDLAIGNRPHAGIAVGRITELTGLEGCVTEDTLVDIIVE